MADSSSGSGYNIVTLMKRLEAATSRLEDLTVFHADSLRKAAQSAAGFDADGASTRSVPVTIDSAKEAPASKEVGAPAEPAPAATQPEDEVLLEFGAIINGDLAKFVTISRGLDPLIEEQATQMYQAFEASLNFIRASRLAVKPQNGDGALDRLFKPIRDEAEHIINIRENNRASKLSNHLATVAEGIPALGWLTVESPLGYIGDFIDSAQFYANRVLKDYKETDKKHVEWARTFSKVLKELLAYVKKYFAKGLQWSAQGKSLTAVLAEMGSLGGAAPAAPAAPPAPPAPPAAAGGPPPPPPPPPLPPADVFKSESAPAGTGGSMGAVFQELNKGESVTAGLKKVDKSQMTHKNPELREESKKSTPPPPKKPASLSSKTAAAAPPTKKPPHKELMDTKWIIENFDGNHDIVIDGEMNQGVFIDRCSNSTIQIKGKVSAITINGCSKIGVLVESLVSGIDVIKSSGFGIQVTGALPTLALDQSHDGQIYLSRETLDLVSIYTSQTSSINLEIPRDAEAGDYIEVPLPEQLLHRISAPADIASVNPDKLVSSTVVAITE